MGGYKPDMKTEMWKSAVEKKLLSNVTPLNRYQFGLAYIPPNVPLP